MMNQDHILRASQDDEMESLVLDDDDSGSPQQPQSPKSPFDSFLDPPSYAEAIFTSFDSNGHDQTLEPSTRSGSDYLHISVFDPKEEQELMNSLIHLALADSEGDALYTLKQSFCPQLVCNIRGVGCLP